MTMTIDLPRNLHQTKNKQIMIPHETNININNKKMEFVSDFSNISESTKFIQYRRQWFYQSGQNYKLSNEM